jgi:cysteine desulfurase
MYYNIGGVSYNMIYIDNNATTQMPPVVMKEMIRWCNMGNPSSGYSSAKSSRMMMNEFSNAITTVAKTPGTVGVGKGAGKGARRLGVGVDEGVDEDADADTTDTYTIIFTSGASEGNSTIITSVVDACLHKRSVTADSAGGIGSVGIGITGNTYRPHIISSAIEHKGLIKTLERLHELSRVDFTLVKPRIDGSIHVDDIESEILPSTVLIAVIGVNNETGVINDIPAIISMAHTHNIPVHCDAVQSFSKFKITSDSFVFSGHKLHGPPGCGVLAIKKKFIAGYGLSAIIHGTQNGGLRGGTENLPGIGATYCGLRYSIKTHDTKHLLNMKRQLIRGFSELMPVISYRKYLQGGIPPRCIVVIGENTVPWTLLFSVVKRDGIIGGDSGGSTGGSTNGGDVTIASTGYICNVKIKDSLERHGIIVSVGSACNTSSAHASHVLYSMGADIYIRKGTLRISLDSSNTTAEITKVISCFREALREQDVW